MSLRQGGRRMAAGAGEGEEAMTPPDLIEQIKLAIRESGLSLAEVARRSGVD